MAKDKNVARLALVGLADEPGIAFKIFSLLAKNRINVDIILQSIGRDSSKDISFTVARGDTERAKALLEEHREAIGFREIEVNEQVAKVSIVGAGMVNNPGVAARMFEALYGASVNINICLLYTSGPRTKRWEPRLEVMTSTVLRKSVLRPRLSVSTPSSITWSRMDQISRWAFSSSSSSTTDQGERRTASVSCPPSSWPT